MLLDVVVDNNNNDLQRVQPATSKTGVTLRNYAVFLNLYKILSYTINSLSKIHTFTI